MSQPIEIPVKISGIGEIRKEIKSLTVDFLNAGNELEKAALAEKIGQLKDSLIDANEQAAIFASGSKYEQIGNAFAGIKGNIMALDFEGASEKAKLLSTAAKGITFKDAIGSLKSLGSTFLTLGKTLLTNPLFLIAAVIAAIGFAIFTILKKLGILDKAFKAVGDAIKKVWEWVKKAIEIMSYFNPAAFIVNYLIKLYEKDAAEKEALENQRKAADERIKQLKQEETAVGDKYDFEIRKLKAAGKDTKEAEAEKRKAILATLAAQNDALRSLIQSGKATQDQIKVWNETNKKIKQINQDTAIAAIESEKAASDAAKKAAEERTKIAQDEAKKKQELAIKFAQDRKNAERLITDLELELIDDKLVKDIAVNKEKYKRLIEDTKTNEALLQSEKDRIIADYEAQRKIEEDKILTENENAEIQRAFTQSQNIQKILLEGKQLGLKEGDTQGLIALKDEAFNIELEALKNQLNTKAITIEEYNAQEALMKQKLADEIDKINEEAAKKELERRKAVQDGAIGLADNALKAAANNAKEGSKLAKGIAVAQATLDTYKGAQAAFASTASSPLAIAFPAAPYIAAASAVAFGIGNIRKILSTKEGASSTPSSSGGSSGGSRGGGGSAGGETVPSFNLFGQANQFNNTSDAKSAESSSGGMVVKAVVSETDITTTQERISKLKQRSEL
jgi:hypothetical protein